MKNRLKNFLIITGFLLLLIYFFRGLKHGYDIGEALLSILFFILEIGDFEFLLVLLGISFIFVGFVRPNENSNMSINTKKLGSKRKYQILRILGYLPFIFAFCMGMFYSITGFSFLFSTSYGISAFFESILVYSFLFWPLYIVGIIIILKSSEKIMMIDDLSKEKGLK